MNIQIIILTENYAYNLPQAEAGFAAMIEIDGKFFLFDTGKTGNPLIDNARLISLDWKKLDGIIISHGHHDHANGLEQVLMRAPGTDIYLHPGVFDNKVAVDRQGNKRYVGIKFNRKHLEYRYKAIFKEITQYTEILSNVYLSGEVPFTNNIEKIPKYFKIESQDGKLIPDTFREENSLFINTNKGIIVITGCGHCGIVNIMEYAKTKLGKNIYAIIGGAHLMRESDERINFVANYLRKENVELIALGHCTGMDVIYKLKDIFPDKTKPAFCGQVFEFENI